MTPTYVNSFLWLVCRTSHIAAVLGKQSVWCKQERLNQVFLGVVLRSNHDCTLVTLRWYHENIGVCTEYTVRIHVLLPQIYHVSFGQVISHYKYAVISQRLWKKVTGNVLLQWLCIKKRQMLLNVGGSFPFCGITINSSSLKIPNKKNKKELRDWGTCKCPVLATFHHSSQTTSLSQQLIWIPRPLPWKPKPQHRL